MTLRNEYLARTDGDVERAATLLTADLMRGDPETFKAGYSRENAALAAAEVFGLDSAAFTERLTERVASFPKPRFE